MSNSVRLPAFDMAKGIGIILVFIAHTPVSFSPIIYSFHMPLFFLISGYFLSCKYDIKTFFAKKVKQLMLPYLYVAAAGTLAMLLYALSVDTGLQLGEIALKRLLANIYCLGGSYTIFHTDIHVQMAGTIWFLPALLVSLLTVRVALKFEWPFLVVLLVSTLSYLLAQIVKLPFSFLQGMNASVFVYIGYASRECGFVFSRTFNSWLTVCVALLFWGISTLYFHFEHFHVSMSLYPNPLMNILASVSMSYALVRICVFVGRIKLISKPLCYIGENTLFLLCVHTFIQAANWLFASEYHIHPIALKNISEWILLYVCVPVLILIVKDCVVAAFKMRLHHGV